MRKMVSFLLFFVSAFDCGFADWLSFLLLADEQFIVSFS